MPNRVRPRPATADRRRRRPTLSPRRLPTVRLPTGRARFIALAALGLALAAIAAWTLWPDAGPRQREYLNVTACLLTDENGVNGEAAKPIWAAMQDGSVTSLVKVQYLAVNGPQTTENARSYVATLAGSQCGAVIAVGPAQIDAAVAAAPAFPNVRFVTIGGGTTGANVSVIDDRTADGLRTAVTQQVTALARTAS